MSIIIVWPSLQCNPSKPATLGTSKSVLIRGVATFQGWICIKKHAFRCDLITGVATFQGSWLEGFHCTYSPLYSCIHIVSASQGRNLLWRNSVGDKIFFGDCLWWNQSWFSEWQAYHGLSSEGRAAPSAHRWRGGVSGWGHAQGVQYSGEMVSWDLCEGLCTFRELLLCSNISESEKFAKFSTCKIKFPSLFSWVLVFNIAKISHNWKQKSLKLVYA